MIFEKNPFTTAVSMPKSFHLTPMSPTFEIHQPTLIHYSYYNWTGSVNNEYYTLHYNDVSLGK